MPLGVAKATLQGAHLNPGLFGSAVHTVTRVQPEHKPVLLHLAMGPAQAASPMRTSGGAIQPYDLQLQRTGVRLFGRPGRECPAMSVANRQDESYAAGGSLT